MGGIGHLKKSFDPLSKKNDIILELNDMSSHYILSIKSYSLLKEVCINCCGSTTSFLKGKEGSLKRRIVQIQILCFTKLIGDIGKEFKSKCMLVIDKMDE